MTYKQIEGARLWLGQAVIPTIIGAVAVMSNDMLRNVANQKFEKLKYGLRKRGIIKYGL